MTRGKTIIGLIIILVSSVISFKLILQKLTTEIKQLKVERICIKGKKYLFVDYNNKPEIIPYKKEGKFISCSKK